MSRLVGCFAVLGRRIQICHAFLRPGVVDAQELVGTGCHVGIPLFRSGKALAGGAKIPRYHNFYEGGVF